jgi:hypothetical protein
MQELLKRIESEGLRLDMCESGALAVEGPGEALERWMLPLRERRKEIAAYLSAHSGMRLAPR